MRTYLFIRHVVILTSLVLIPWLPALAAEPPSADTPALVSALGQDSVAAGAVEDTLKACLARIPTDATAGQRMLAEQSCKMAEGDRKLDSAAPKF